MVISLKQAIGQNVRAARLGCGLTQEELAERIARTAETVSNIERGKNPPSVATLRDIAVALGVSLDTMILGTDRAVSGMRLRHEAALIRLVHVMEDADLEVALTMLEALVKRGSRKN